MSFLRNKPYKEPTIAHNMQIKFLFGLLFAPVIPYEQLTPKEKTARRKIPIDRDEVNAYRRHWRKELNCWQSDKKYKTKRKTYGKIKLNPKFKGSHSHHVNNKYIINIPSGLHKQYPHYLKIPESMNEINREAFKYLMNEMMS